MVRIAVIEKNNCNFDNLGDYALPLLYTEHSADSKKEIRESIDNYIWSVIEPFVTFVDVSDEDFITVVCSNIIKDFPDRPADKFFYHTEGSYSFPKKYMEFIYAQPSWSDYKIAQVENINTIGCLFSLKQNFIENTVIIVANTYDLSAEKLVVMTCVTKNDIIKTIKRRFYFSAVLIKENSMIKYYYQDPKFLIGHIYGLSNNDTIEKLSLSHLKYNLVFYFRQNKDTYVNKIATRINGSYRLHGDVLILHEMEENIYSNISITEMKRLNVLSYGRLYDRQLKPDEVHTETKVMVDENGKEEEKKITPFWSRYIVINNRMNKWKLLKNACVNCGIDVDVSKKIICQQCYRARYCSDNCKREFASYHNDECISTKTVTK